MPKCTTLVTSNDVLRQLHGRLFWVILPEDLDSATEATFDHVHANFVTEDDASFAGAAQDSIEARNARLAAFGDGWGVETALGIRCG